MKFHDTATRYLANGKAKCHATPDSAANCPDQYIEANSVVLSSIARPEHVAQKRGEVSPPRLGSAQCFVASS